MDPTESLATHWGLSGIRVTPLGGGMNSETWVVEHEGSTYVAKSVSPDAVAALVAGAEVAVVLAEAGFATGRPVPARDGRIVVTELGLLLLEHVPGRDLGGETDEEQVWIAGTLAGVHYAGNPTTGPSVAPFAQDWISPDLPGVADHAWLAPAIEAVRAETDPLTLTWSFLHTDPFPGAFIHDDTTGVTGLIDWAGARRGPVLYDVASAVMYLGGARNASAFLSAYRSEGPLESHEMDHLDAFGRFREVVQGVYFAGRLSANDLTGGIEHADNVRGLDEARHRLAALGLDYAR